MLTALAELYSTAYHWSFIFKGRTVFKGGTFLRPRFCPCPSKRGESSASSLTAPDEPPGITQLKFPNDIQYK